MNYLERESMKREEAKAAVLEQAKLIYSVLVDRQGEEIKVIDISDISVLADYFIIVHGRNISHIDALVTHVDEKLSQTGVHPKHIEKSQNNGWILMDYGNIIVHVFSEQDRKFYELERIWADGKVITF